MSIAAASNAIRFLAFTGNALWGLAKFTAMRGALPNLGKIILAGVTYLGWKYKDSDFRTKVGKPLVEEPLERLWQKVPEEWRKYIENALKVLGAYIASGGDIQATSQEAVVQVMDKSLEDQGVNVDKQDLNIIASTFTGGDPLAHKLAAILAETIPVDAPKAMVTTALVPFITNVLGNDLLKALVGPLRDDFVAGAVGRGLGEFFAVNFGIDNKILVHAAVAGAAGAAGGGFALFRGVSSPGASISPAIAIMLDPQIQKIAKKCGVPQKIVDHGSGVLSVCASHLVVKVVMFSGGAMAKYAQEEPEEALKTLMLLLTTTAIGAGGYYILYQAHGETIVEWYKDALEYTQSLTNEQFEKLLEKNPNFNRSAFKPLDAANINEEPRVVEVFEEEPEGVNQKVVENSDSGKEKEKASQAEKGKAIRSKRSGMTLYSPLESRLSRADFEDGVVALGNEIDQKADAIMREIQAKIAKAKNNIEQTKEQTAMALVAAVVLVASNMPKSSVPFISVITNRYSMGILPMKPGECKESWEKWAEQRRANMSEQPGEYKRRADSSLSLFDHLGAFFLGGVAGIQMPWNYGDHRVSQRYYAGFMPHYYYVNKNLHQATLNAVLPQELPIAEPTYAEKVNNTAHEYGLALGC
ncbi:MAG: hypothetical protein K0R73_862 [Candidatus Midichloriaceae bacterium]|jgi:hypothetical protein|nr:hypothetical protein [Candidatus Midichloriaceae bacterium]